MHIWAHGRVLADVCVAAVAGSFEGELRSSDPGCVGCFSKPRTTKKFQAFPPLSGPHTFNSFFSFPLFSLRFLALSCFPFFSSSRGSPWQGAGAEERKWVSGSAPATGSGWLLSPWNASPVPSAEHPSTLQLTNLPYFSLLFQVYTILGCFCRP